MKTRVMVAWCLLQSNGSRLASPQAKEKQTQAARSMQQSEAKWRSTEVLATQANVQEHRVNN